MATYDLEEQEQIDELRTWWKLHGSIVVSTLLVLAAAFVAWQGWTVWSRNENAKAAQSFVRLQAALDAKDDKQVRDLAGLLIANHSGSRYALLGAVAAAPHLAATGDAKSAIAMLEWARDHSPDPGLTALVTIRLVALGASTTALPDGEVTQLRARMNEVQADSASAANRPRDADTGYREALSLEDKESAQDPVVRSYRAILEGKIDNIDRGGKGVPGEGK